MSSKKEKKDTVKNTSRTKKTPMLKLDNGNKIPARIVYAKDNDDCFGINDIDINKIGISERSLYWKQHNVYKYYVLYEHNSKYIPLRITLRDIVGYYVYNGDDKRMNFKINNEHHGKICQGLENIFEHIEEKLSITLNDFTFEKKVGSCFKIKVTDETCFIEKIKPTLILKEGKVTPKESDANFTPKKTLCILVEYYFKCNLFSLKLKIKKMT